MADPSPHFNQDLLHRPHARLMGNVDEDMLRTLLDALEPAEDGDGDLAVEISTLGGDAEVARRMVLEIDLARSRLPARRFVFIGKTTIYSAGVTIMSAFPKQDRFITSDAVLLIHSRQLDKTLELSGPLRGSLPKVQALQQQLETGCRLEEKGFARLIEGSDIPLHEVKERGLHNWYLTAQEALDRGLVAALL